MSLRVMANTVRHRTGIRNKIMVRKEQKYNSMTFRPENLRETTENHSISFNT